MELEERIARVELLVARYERLNRWEHAGMAIAKLILLLIALAVTVTYALSDLAVLLINRIEFVRSALRL